MKATAKQVKHEYIEAIRLFKIASELGNPSASHNIGVMYFHGMGAVLQDYKLAAKWYQKAAEQGFPASNLASMYSNGQGVIQSDTEAYIWSALSDRKNSPSNTTNRMAKKLSPLEIKEADKEVEKLYNKIYGKK